MECLRTSKSLRSGFETCELTDVALHLAKNELELELIQTQMTQKPMLRTEVHAHAMRASHSRK